MSDIDSDRHLALQLNALEKTLEAWLGRTHRRELKNASTRQLVRDLVDEAQTLRFEILEGEIDPETRLGFVEAESYIAAPENLPFNRAGFRARMLFLRCLFELDCERLSYEPLHAVRSYRRAGGLQSSRRSPDAKFARSLGLLREHVSFVCSLE